MPLNYSKWDALELSDDSDIEGHPNVDHKSLVRWKQRDIHEKREARKQRIAEYESIIALNEVLIPRVKNVIKDVDEGGPEKYSAIAEKLQKSPSPEKPKTGDVTYDVMIGALLIKIRDELKSEGNEKPEGADLVGRLKQELEKMEKTDKDSKAALADEIAEQKKKITSEDIHDGFSSTNVTHEEPVPVPAKAKGKAKAAEPQYEVLNPSRPNDTVSQPPTSSADDGDDEDERIPDLSPTLEAFTKIPLGNFEKIYAFIQAHPREIVRPGVYDQLVIAGFRAGIKGDRTYAKQCVHQALIVQYCDKLGKDGVQLFFKRMASGDPRAKMVFDKDLDDTYTMMMTRASKAAQDEEPRERIQLVAEDPAQSITFNVPDGPPPETIRLEGPGTEGLDPAEVKAALQRRWDIFEGFDDTLKKALKSGNLDEVNDVLGDMDVTAAEDIVKLLEIAGILSFSRTDIVDQTGQGDAVDAGASGTAGAEASGKEHAGDAREKKYARDADNDDLD